jgi:hypothetical protein
LKCPEVRTQNLWFEKNNKSKNYDKMDQSLTAEEIVPETAEIAAARTAGIRTHWYQ